MAANTPSQPPRLVAVPGLPRQVGVCSHCGSAVLRLVTEGELASCRCGKASIPDTMITTARRMKPGRADT